MPAPAGVRVIPAARFSLPKHAPCSRSSLGRRERRDANAACRHRGPPVAPPRGSINGVLAGRRPRAQAAQMWQIRNKSEQNVVTIGSARLPPCMARPMSPNRHARPLRPRGWLLGSWREVSPTGMSDERGKPFAARASFEGGRASRGLARRHGAASAGRRNQQMNLEY